MSRVIIKGNLSRNSFKQIVKELKDYKRKLNKGAELGIEEASLKLYDLILEKMDSYNLSDHKGEVKHEKITIGRHQAYKVYTNDIVIMFHEFGTGIKGTNDKWANTFGYTVNASGKGEKGWYFYNKKNNYGGITHGLTSKHIFYEALMEIEKDLAKEVQVQIDLVMSK